MPLDLHRVRSISSEASRKVPDLKREVTRVLDAYKGMGSAFTGDNLFSREYSNLSSAVREAERALEKVQSAIGAIDRKSR